MEDGGWRMESGEWGMENGDGRWGGRQVVTSPVRVPIETPPTDVPTKELMGVSQQFGKPGAGRAVGARGMAQRGFRRTVLPFSP